jgi:hypothetical protein
VNRNNEKVLKIALILHDINLGSIGVNEIKYSIEFVDFCTAKFRESIKYSYSESVEKEFGMFKPPSEEEYLAFYYIENALFRTSSLWDILAQLYRLFYNIKVTKEAVYYKKIFDPTKCLSDNFKNKAKEIHTYINEDEIEGAVECKGNHAFTNEFRNKMTHRNSPSITTCSNFDMNLKEHPVTVIEKILQDYKVVSKYINEILGDIEMKIFEELDLEKEIRLD